MVNALAGLVIGLHTVTAHPWVSDDTPAAHRPNDETPGIYARTADGWTGGLVLNSNGRTSGYLGKTFETENKRFALTLGGITGYDKRRIGNWVEGISNTKVMPLVAPSVRLGTLLGATPRIAVFGKAINLSFEWVTP